MIGIYRLDIMPKIIQINIFIYGMKRAGKETAKNLSDLTSNYFLKEEDVIKRKRKRKDESCF